MPSISSNSITIEYELFGDKGPVVVLIMGLGMQMVAWPTEFIQAIVSAGYRVLRFDNRDIGLSTWFDQKGKPSLALMAAKYAVRLPISAPYNLTDMANDAVGVCDALQIKQAHWIGVSMGGMIAQLIAVNHPNRVLSLISIMSSSGARNLPGPTIAARKALMQRPPKVRDPAKRTAVWVEHTLKLLTVIGSPNNPAPDDEIRARLRASIERSLHPEGTLRQMAAILSDGDRSERLKTIKVPTLIVHGTVDPLVPMACGQDTAKKIAHSRFVSVVGMGHDLAPVAQSGVLAAVIPFIGNIR